MRIISGKFKNKKLYFPKNIKTRPLKDSVRENIFNILCHSKNINIEYSKFKYSGSLCWYRIFWFRVFIKRSFKGSFFVENNKML